MSTQLTTAVNQSIFESKLSFDEKMQIAQQIANSSIIPAAYSKNPQNVIVAMEYANRLKQSPLSVMQNLHIISGKPTLSATFLIGLVNTSGLYSSPMRFHVEGKDATLSCYAYTFCKETQQKLQGTTVTMRMVTAEGWDKKAGSKWLTMPEQMIKYRAASFFTREFCPELIMGMHTEDEMVDSGAPPAAPTSNVLEVLQPQDSPLASAERVEKAIGLCGLELATIEEYLGKPREGFTDADMNKLANLYQLSRKQGKTCAEVIAAEKAEYTDVEVVEIPAE